MDNFEYKASIIVPVYNVEKYLAECLDSLAAQTMDKSQMEVLMIDDGSPDNSIAIMEEYAAKYPYMKIFRKENEGLAKTRNYGIAHAKGKYLFYLDSDDMLTEETVKAVTDFFDEHYDEVDLVSYKMEYMLGPDWFGNPHFRYKRLLKDGIYDLNLIENTFITQTNINVCVKNVPNPILFDTNPDFRHEDQKYCTQILQPKMKYGFCEQGRYLYRQQPESTVRTYFYAYYIFETTMRFWEELFNDYADENVPKYIQGLYLNDLNWKTTQDILLPYHYDAEHLEAAKQRLLALLDKVDDDVILRHPVLTSFRKHFFINLKNNKNIKILPGYDDSIAISNNEKVILYTSKVEIQIYKFRSEGSKLRICGFVKSPVFNYLPKPQLYAVLNGSLEEKKELELKASSWSYYMAKQITNSFWDFCLDIDMEEVNSLQFRVAAADQLFYTYCLFRPKLMFSSTRKCYNYCKDGWRYSYNRGVFRFAKITDREEKTWKKKRLQAFKTNKWTYLTLRVAQINIHAFNNLWLYSDCKGVSKDNAWFQFEHDFDKKDGVQRYYVLNAENFAEARKQYPTKYQKHIVRFGSRLHKIMFLKARKIIAAYIEDENVVPFLPHVYNAYFEASNDPEVIYLQHGVLHSHQPWKYSQDRLQIDKEVISTGFECNNLERNYCFTSDSLIPCGMPRYDFIDHDAPAQRRILFAPSWRKYLVGRSNNEWVTTENKFQSSVFFSETQKFLNSPELEALLEKYDYYLDFKLHPIFKRYQDCYKITNPRIIIDDEKRKDADYAVFITDFSSYEFDFVYLKRAMLYFFPDEEMFRAGMNGYRELDLPHNQGFGEEAHTAEEAVAAVARILKNGGKAEPLYQKRMEGFFLHYDNNQRDRLYEAISRNNNGG